MKKRILLIGYNYYPEFTGIGKYSGEMIYWLAKNGYDCTVITTYPYYPQWKVNPAYEKKRFWYSEETKEFSSGGRIKVYRCPMYIPANPSGFKRMVLDFSFLLTAGLKLIQVLFGKKRDLVITIAPSFLVGLLGVLYKTARSSKLMYHIQDLQIEAARDLNMIKSKAVINILFAIEKFILTRCNYITSISDEMVKKIQGKVGKEVHLLVNPVDVSVLYPIQNREMLKAEFGFDKSDKVFLYSGAIGEKQGLEAILHAADELREHKEMKFIICGSGPYKEKLINLANNLQLENVTFLPLQPLTKLNQFLNLADVHFVIQKASASDLVMPSKLTSILSVGGLSIVTANPGSGLYDLVDQNGIGVLVESENHAALVEGIKKAAYIENKQIRENARLYAVNNLSIDGVMGHFERFLNFDTGNKPFPVAQGQPVGVTSETGDSGL